MRSRICGFPFSWSPPRRRGVSFGKTEKADEFHLYDLSTNLECNDYSSEIGIELFDLDSTSFKRSIFIAQKDCAAEASDGINAKLGNVAESTNDINYFEGANQHLKEILNQLTPDRVTGSIKKRKNYITQLTQELRTFDSARDGYEGVSRKKKTIDGQIEELLGIRKNYADALVIASEDSRKRELYKQYDILCDEVCKKEKIVEEYAKLFPEKVPSQGEFEAQMKYIRLLEETNTSMMHYKFTENEEKEFSNLLEMFGDKKPSVEGIDAAIETLNDMDKFKEELGRQESRYLVCDAKKQEITEDEAPSNGSFGQMFIYLGLAVLIVGGIVGVFGILNPLKLLQSQILWICGAAIATLGGVFTLIGIILKSKAKKVNGIWLREKEDALDVVDNELELLRDNIRQIKNNSKDVLTTICTFLETYHVYCETDKYQAKLYELKVQLAEYERLEEKRQRYEDLKKQYDAGVLIIRDFEEAFQCKLGEDRAERLSFLQSKATEYRIAQDAYKESLRKREEFENAQEKSFWTREASCPYSLEELNHMIMDADSKLEELKLAQGQYIKQLEDLQEQMDLCDEKSEELEEQLALQQADIEKYNLVKLTQEFLQKAKEQFVAKYMDPIAKGFSKYYTMLTGDTRGEWMIDANINLKVKEYGELRETHWLSAGYQDLIGVCMRLAMVDAMYQEEKPFLILDDPFVNLDQEKVEMGNKLLLDVSRDYQVIYFTCHNSRCP